MSVDSFHLGYGHSLAVQRCTAELHSRMNSIGHLSYLLASGMDFTANETDSEAESTPHSCHISDELLTTTDSETPARKTYL